MSEQVKHRVDQRGFTLIEVMIATVVALFATLAIMQSFAVSEGYRRTTTSGGDATFTGAVATYLLGRDLQMAGYGVNTAAYLGCTVSGSDQSASPAQPISFTLAPAQITPGGASDDPDSITVVSSSSAWLPAPITLTAAMASPTDNYQINNPFGVTAGDVMVLAQSGNGACTLVQATNTPTSGTPGNQNTIKHVSGTYSQGAGTAHARYNPSGGIGPAYPAGSVLMDLGASPTVNSYFIQNNTLMVTLGVGAGNQAAQTTQPVAANIVQLKAFYGRDTVGGGTITVWDTNTPTTATGWAAVLAIRVALVARSAQPERQVDAHGDCSTTTASPTVTWDDGSQTQLDLSSTAPSGPAWQCYRYKVFHMTASLRNSIWTPS
jgi:type IV pilus assembly protein PilW